MDIQAWGPLRPHIWLAASISIREDQSIVNVGAGQGYACFELARRFPNLRIHGIEWNRDNVRQAAEFVRAEQWQGRVEILHGDGVTLPPRLAAGTFDQVMMHWTGEAPPDLSDQMRTMLMMLKPQGVMTMLMEPAWLPYMLNAWGERVGNVNIFPLWFEGKATADYIILQAQKNAQDPFVVHKGFVVDQNGELGDLLYQSIMGPMT